MFRIKNIKTKEVKDVGVWGCEFISELKKDEWIIEGVDLSNYEKEEKDIIKKVLNEQPGIKGIELIRYAIDRYTLGLLGAYIDCIGIDSNTSEGMIAAALNESDIYFDVKNEIDLAKEVIMDTCYIPSELKDYINYAGYGDELKKRGYKIYDDFKIAIKFI